MSFLGRFKNKEQMPYELTAFVEGKSIRLENVKDEVFSSNALGKGIGIIPVNGKIVAPISGMVSMIFPTKHALGIKTDVGIEILIHIGIDTVKMNGEGFDLKVMVNQKIKRGDVLIDVDFPLIEKNGFDTTVISVITNTEEFKDISIIEDDVTIKDIVLKVEKE